MVAIHFPLLRISKLLLLGCFWIFLFAGCASTPSKKTAVYSGLPKEMAKTSLEDYYIGISDILSVEVINLVPKSPYLLKPMDTVYIQGYGLDEEAEPIDGHYRVQPGGNVVLPYPFKSVEIGGLTCEQAGEKLSNKLYEGLKSGNDKWKETQGVLVSIETVSGLQPVAGNHIVGPDGCINLGIYGKAHVNGLTVNDARAAIEMVLSESLEHPQVAVDIYSYNSQSYYVVMQGAGYGDKSISFPYTGNETVLDAITNINGLERVSSKRIWIARPSYGNTGYCYRKLEVDWDCITAGASPYTNYQLMPNDRVFIAEDHWVAFDTKLSKIIAPFERIMGFSMLGAQTVTRFSGSVLKGGGERLNYR